MIELVSTHYKHWLHDNFLSTEQISEAVTQTGFITKKLCEIKLETGLQQGSYARINYNNGTFNPLYSVLQMKLKFNSDDSIFAFWGFKEDATNPTFDMTESHAGFMINTEKNVKTMYSSTGNSDPLNPAQQRIALSGIDPTNFNIYKIIHNQFWTRPLPIVQPYFGDIRLIRPTRAWGLAATNSTITPMNEIHYVMLYIENKTNAERYIELKHITLGEEYAD